MDPNGSTRTLTPADKITGQQPMVFDITIMVAESNDYLVCQLLDGTLLNAFLRQAYGLEPKDLKPGKSIVNVFFRPLGQGDSLGANLTIGDGPDAYITIQSHGTATGRHELSRQLDQAVKSLLYGDGTFAYLVVADSERVFFRCAYLMERADTDQVPST